MSLWCVLGFHWWAPYEPDWTDQLHGGRQCTRPGCPFLRAPRRWWWQL